MKLPNLSSTSTMFNVLREVDVRAIKDLAESAFTLAFISRDVPMAEHLADMMYSGPREQDIPLRRTCAALPLNTRTDILQEVNVVVLIARDGDTNETELKICRELGKTNTQVLICLLREATKAHLPPPMRQHWLPASVITLTTPIDDATATQTLVNAILELKKVEAMSLARHLPAFRNAVARDLIEDVANANAAYSFGTGLLEIVPVANVPLNATDMLVLTKNQAILAYKIALAMGMNTDFKEIMPKLAAVVGGGFLFRQAARSLIGLLPGLGILPKVGVAFAGTYATGEAILRWCATGEKMNTAALKAAYEIALTRGKAVAQSLWEKRKHLRKPKLLSSTK
jgi:uncharacterized protein (DUF697 family)